MRVVLDVMRALIVPRSAFDDLAPAMRWLWIALAALFMASVVTKAVVTTPARTVVEGAQIEAAMQAELDRMSEAERSEFDATMAQVERVDVAPAMRVVAHGLQAIGAFIALVYVATFVSLGARIGGTTPVPFPTALTLAGLTFIPAATRNLAQAIYTVATGVWLQHPGLASLVAPADPAAIPGIDYVLLGLIDLWVIWGLWILFGTLRSKTLGLPPRTALVLLAVFVVVTGALQSLPGILTILVGGMNG